MAALLEGAAVGATNRFSCAQSVIAIESHIVTALFSLSGIRFRDVFAIESMAISPSAITVVQGASGCGKTTLLRLLNRMSRSDSGTIRFHDDALDTIDPVALRRKVVMLPQSPVLFSHSVRDEVVAGCRFAGMEEPTEERINAALEAVRLDKALPDDPTPFSGGEKQRLALARVMLMEPEVLLLDEPSAGLDAETEEAVFAVIRSRRDAGSSVVLASHSGNLAALGPVDRWLFRDGRVIPAREVQ